MMAKNETKIIDPTDEEVLDFTYSITSYGADYPVDSLVKRMRDKKIKVHHSSVVMCGMKSRLHDLLKSCYLGYQ